MGFNSGFKGLRCNTSEIWPCFYSYLR